MHEQSITFQLQHGPHQGKWVNTPGIYNGKKIDEDTAHGLVLEGKLPLLGGIYNTLPEADMAAQIRSTLFGPEETINYDKLQPLFQQLIQGMHPGR
jgi:hypothetical protein